MGKREVGIDDGVGYGDGYRDGDGNGNGVGYGYGAGYGYGDGYGFGDGTGDGDGDGHGYGDGDGDGSIKMFLKASAERGIINTRKSLAEENIELRRLMLEALGDRINAREALAEENIELRRLMLEALGDRIFAQLEGLVVHADRDGYDNPRKLLRIQCKDAEAGYLQAVQVVCPTTHRIYHLGVGPEVKTCQQAVAQSFGLKPEFYMPERES